MPRDLSFDNYDQMLAEVDRLQKGNSPTGKWNLGQTCEHLNYFVAGSLDGYTFKCPWLLKVLFGRIALNRILSKRQMKSGIPTPQKPLPPPDVDQVESVDKFRKIIQRLRTHSQPFHPSPFFGVLTPDQWRELHLIHAAHHLAYLEPTR